MARGNIEPRSKRQGSSSTVSVELPCRGKRMTGRAGARSCLWIVSSRAASPAFPRPARDGKAVTRPGAADRAEQRAPPAQRPERQGTVPSHVPISLAGPPGAGAPGCSAVQCGNSYRFRHGTRSSGGVVADHTRSADCDGDLRDPVVPFRQTRGRTATPPCPLVPGSVVGALSSGV